MENTLKKNETINLMAINKYSHVTCINTDHFDSQQKEPKSLLTKREVWINFISSEHHTKLRSIPNSNKLPSLWLIFFHEFHQDELVFQWRKHMRSCYHNLAK